MLFCRIIAISVLLISACTETRDAELPAHIRELENLTVYSADAKTDTVRLEREQTFGDTKEVLFQRMNEVAVDSSGRVFIVEGAMGHRTIHVFQPDGRYLTNIGRQGDGPGEFQTPSKMKIKGSQLYIYDNMHQRINVFSLDSLSFSHAMLPQTKGIKGSWLNNYFVRSDRNFLISYRDPSFPNDPERYIHYYVFDHRGDKLSDKIFEQKATTIFGDKTDGISITTIVPFRGKSLIDFSNSDQFFSAWTEDFLIKVYNSNGKYLRSFYYPYSRSKLNRDVYLSGISNRTFRRAFENMEFPKTWPALNSMLVDNENRLWVSTIGDDPEMYQWWVLEVSGKLLVRFTWPKDKSIR